MNTNRNTNGKVEILIAEDSPTQAAQLAHLLEQRGYTVTTAANGREALALLERRKPTLVISDIVMPELDGYGLCKAIKSDKKLQDIPVMLVTTLSDPQDVIRGLECGADNFLRKPYDERYLLARIDYLLMNLALRKDQKMQIGMEIDLGGQKYFISSERQQMLDLLISTYEQAVGINGELKQREKELAHSSQALNGLYRIADGLNHAASERQVLEMALERALELPGIQAGWISLREGESGFRLAAARNLPPALEADGAMEGDCTCRRGLMSGELDRVTNIMECQRLSTVTGDTRGLRYHVSVPLWIGDRSLGVMNLIGPEKGLFNEDELKILYSVGNQVAVALERAYLHENLETLVRARTAELEAEIVERKRIEKEQARLVAIIEATPDMVATGDPRGHALYYNRAGSRMLGFEPGLDVSTVRFLDTHPDWAAKLVAETGIPHAIEHGTWSGETALLRRDGREIPISQVIIAHKGSDGSVEYLSTIARDITWQKENEKRITRLNRVYAVLSGINTTIVRTRDRQDLFDEACRIAVELGKFRLAWIGLLDANGLDVTPVARAGVDECYLDNVQLTARDDAPDRCELVARALREKTTVVCNDIDTDPQMAHWREEALRRGYRSVVVFPLQLEDKVAGLLALYASEAGVFDTEEMRLLTEIAGDLSFALAHTEKVAELRLQGAALNATANSIVITDRTGTIEWVNPAFTALTGYRADEAIGKNQSELSKSDVHDQLFYRNLWDTILTGQVWNGELTNRRKDGSLYTVEMTITPVEGAPGEITHFITINQDLTERKRLEAQFLQAQKMESMGRLAGGVAHDFNNLLTVILGSAEIMTTDVTMASQHGEDLGEITKAAQRAAGLTRQLLAFSRQQVLQAAPLDVNGLITDMAGMLGRLIGEQIEVALGLAPDLSLVLADRGQLEQVVMNLVINARDAMPDGGSVTLETANVELENSAFHEEAIIPGQYVMLAITDTGGGMTKETQQRLFEPFFTTKEVGQGTGLGLSMTYGIVKQSKGYIWVYSEPSLGTTFKVYLPRSDRGVPLPVVSSAVTAPDKSPSETVLLVEDEAGVRQLVKRVLEKTGYRVLAAANGDEGERLFAQHSGSIDLLVTDVVMPGCDGPELLGRLRVRAPGLRVLYMSGYTEQSAALKMGIDRGLPFVQKPFTAAELMRQVREALDR